jgi:hypothetical protein
MNATDGNQTAVKEEDQPRETRASDAMQTKSPMPGVKLPPITWMLPSTLPGHDTDIRDYGINE